MTRKKQAAFILSVFVAAIVMLCSYIFAKQLQEQLRKQKLKSLESISERISKNLQESIDIAVHDLRSLQAFFSASEYASSTEFQNYTDVLQLESRPYISALSWAPLLSSENRKIFEEKIREYYPDFNILTLDETKSLVESPIKSYYVPVTFIAPYTSINKRAQGFDLNSNNTRRESLNYARDSGKMAATAKIQLVQDLVGNYSFLLIAPVYKGNVVLHDAAARSQALDGYVTGVFRINNLVKNTQDIAEKQNMVVSLIDKADIDGGILFGDSVKNNLHAYDIDIPNRHWKLYVSASQVLQNDIDSNNVFHWIFITGIIVAIFFGACIFGMRVIRLDAYEIEKLHEKLELHNSELESTIADRTNALAEKNLKLNKNIEELTLHRTVLSSVMEDTAFAKKIAEQKAVELERSNRDLNDFAYIASHDLKAPLRGIDQLASWIEEDFKNGDMEDIPENITLIRQRAKRLEKLLTDLLQYSKVNRESISINEINSLSLVNELFVLSAPPPEFTLTVENEMPVFETDRAPFELVIRNLLSNAIKHHDKPNGNIQVSCTEEDDFYLFSVKDDGPGIGAEFHDKIFRMFTTLKPRDDVEGSGMGLALIKRVVEYHQGKLYLESKVGHGSTFSFTWPKSMKNLAVNTAT